MMDSRLLRGLILCGFALILFFPGCAQNKTKSSRYGIESAVSSAITQIISEITKSSTIVVLPITTQNNTLKEYITSESEYMLVNAGFNVVDRASLDRIRTEQRLQTSGEIDDRTISSMGRFAGANYIITGVIFGQGNLQRLQMRVLDVQTADVVCAPSVPFEDSQPILYARGIEDAVLSAMQQATKRLSHNSILSIDNVVADNKIADFIRGESEVFLINQAFRVVDRGQLDRIRAEQRIQISGEVDDKTSASIGKLAGADYLITIRVDGQGTLTRLRWRILNTQSALVVGVASVHYQGENAQTPESSLETALSSALPQAISKLNKSERIAIVQVSAPVNSQRVFVMEESEILLVNKGYRVVDRSTLDIIRAEQRIQRSGEVDSKTTVDIGKFAGAKYIMTGRIDGSNSLRRLRLRFLDTETAEVVGVASVRIP